MSQKRVLEALMSLGLSETEARVYIFLAKDGPHKGRDIAEALKLYKEQLYLSLKNLQNKGLVKASLEHPARFSSVPFENVLDSFKEAKLGKAQLIEEKKDELLLRWRTMIKKNST